MKITSKIPQGLKSRKFWAAIVSAIVLFINKFYGTNINTIEVLGLLTPVFIWMGVEGYVDANRM